MFSTVIVNYKSDHYLEACLDSLEKAFEGVSGFEALIVDADPDKQGQSFSAKAFMRMIQAANGGFGAGCNRGAKEACQDILFFLNPDTDKLAIDPGVIAEKFRQDPKLGALSIRLIGSDGKDQDWAFGKEATLARIIANNLGLGKSLETDPIDWVSGTALFVRRSLFERLGGFDEGFFMYFEDADLCRRIRQAGYRIAVLPEFSVRHYGGGSYGASAKEQKAHYYASQDRYFRKHRPRFEQVLLKVLRKAQL